MTSYEVRSAAGALIRTFDSRGGALSWLRAKPEGRFDATNGELFPGWRLEEVQRIERRRQIARDRSHIAQPHAVEACA